MRKKMLLQKKRKARKKEIEKGYKDDLMKTERLTDSSQYSWREVWKEKRMIAAIPQHLFSDTGTVIPSPEIF